MTTPPTNPAFDLAAMAWGPGPNAAEALRQLARAHCEEVRADVARTHPTWLARAVQDESPAVRAIVAGFGPPNVQSALQTAFGAPRTPDRSPHPEVLDWVLTLWAERLVGGEAERPDDPPVILALARLSPHEAYRLWQGVGQAKRRLAEDPNQTPEIRASIQRDIEAVDRARPGPPRRTALLGLTTAARLLADCDQFRSRWALQRLPYPVAKWIRRLTPPAERRSAAISQFEGRILKSVRDGPARAEGNES